MGERAGPSLKSLGFYWHNLWSWVVRAPRRAKALLALILAAVLYTLWLRVDEATYVWQSTALAELVRPVQRRSCQVALPMNDPAEPTVDQEHPSTLKIAMLYLYDKIDPAWDAELVTRLIANKKDYCAKHGFDLIDASNLIDHSKPAAWSKLLAIKHHLPRYDYVFYVDMDVIIMNKLLSLETYVRTAPASKDFIITADWNGLNTGNFFARRSPWTAWFLETAWNQTQLVTKKSPEGIAYPFEYEQRAFHYLLNTDIWQTRHLRPYAGDIEALKQHFYFFPQCAFNSYSIHPFYWKGDPESAQYVRGDFLIHFAGKKGQKRVDLLKHYLDQLGPRS